MKPTEPVNWHILTGEYPPQVGGVADYTHNIACALAGHGDQVTVWAPAISKSDPSDDRVAVRRLPDHFGLRGLWQLDRALRTERHPYRLLVQYVPQAYGYHGLNLMFCLWLRLCCPVRPEVMFHEVHVTAKARDPVWHRVLATGTQVMAALVAQSAAHTFISSRRWSDRLKRLTKLRVDPVWLPIPSNLPAADPQTVAEVRTRWGGPHGLIGHFGTYASLVTDLLEPTLRTLVSLRMPPKLLLVGRGAKAYTEAFVNRMPAAQGQVVAVDDVPPAVAAAHLGACDLLIQPYADGADTRRTSLMAGLALGRPVVTNVGAATAPFWRESAAVCLADPSEFAIAVTELLANPVERERLGHAGAALYRERFSLPHLIGRLRATR